jgi:predicted esterase
VSREHRIRVDRTARYYTLGDPVRAPECWVVVHGYGQLGGRFIRRFATLPGVAEGERAVVAPEALSRFYVERETGPHGAPSTVGASWMTREEREHEIDDYVAYLDRVVEEGLEGRAPRLVVLGFSQGCETASRWVVLGRVRPAELVLWGGGVAADLAPDRLRDGLRGVRVRQVVGSRDRWAQDKAVDTHGRLEGLDVGLERIDYEGGHAVLGEVLDRYWG